MAVFRLHSELSEERSLRLKQLQHGGILEVTDPSIVHLVKVSTTGELNTQRWRIFVPKGRAATLNTRLELQPKYKLLTARLPRKEIVVSDLSPSNPVAIGAGEFVITVHCTAVPEPGLEVSLAGETSADEKFLRPTDGTLEWLARGSYQDITNMEYSNKTDYALSTGHTDQVVDGSTFVLARFREWQDGYEEKEKRSTSVGEVLVWIQVD
jgi:hypothetical protein